MAFKVAIFVAVVASAIAMPDQRYAPPAPSYRQPAVADAPAQYSFDWAVKDEYSGNDFGQTENRDGDYTQGSYYVALPDGRLQKVTYSVNGDSGFIADVSYVGEPQYPQPASKGYAPPAPRYN